MEYKELKKNISDKLARNYGITAKEATNEQMFRAIQLTLRDILAQKKANYNYKVKAEQGKRIYYLCIEFLMGRQLRNYIYNLGLAEDIKTIVEIRREI